MKDSLLAITATSHGTHLPVWGVAIFVLAWVVAAVVVIGRLNRRR
ncbi:hypothetical protein [Streptomyces sp. NPDC049040]